MCKKGWSILRIARELGCSDKTVVRRLADYGLWILL
jgi:hypothetical protein